MSTPKIFINYRGLPRSIYVLFISIIINRLGNFVVPFLAIYLTKNLHYAADKAGFYVMLASVAAIPGIFIGGMLVDRIGRKNVLALFQFLSACCYIPCAFFPESFMVPLLMILAVFFADTAHVAHNAMVADLTSARNRKEAFSLIYLGVNIGFSIGPVIAGFLFSRYIRIFFLADSLTTFISVALVLMFTQEVIKGCYEKNEHNDESTSYEKAETGNVFSVVLKRPFFLAFVGIYFLYTFVYSQTSFSMPLYLGKVFSDSGAQIYGLLMTANALFVVCASTFITMFTAKNSPIANVALAGIFYGIGFGMIFFIHSFAMFIISTIIWTIGEILASVNSNVYISDHSPVSHRGRFNSISLFSKRAGIALGPFIAGIFIKSYSIQKVWPAVFLLSIGASAVIFMIGMAENKFGIEKIKEVI